MLKFIISNSIQLGILLTLIFTVFAAFRNLKELNKGNIIARENIRFKNLSDTLQGICLGILNPLGTEQNNEDKIYFNAAALNRIVKNGFYDGIRAFLGEMMKFPYYESYDCKENFIQRADCFYYGPYRYGITWNKIFEMFQEACNLIDLPSGLESYFDGQCHHPDHDNILSQSRIIPFEVDGMNFKYLFEP